MAFVIHNEQFQAGYIDQLQQNLDAFNGASNGTISMSSGLVLGDKSKESYWNGTVDIVDRDVTADGDVTQADFGQAEIANIKVPFRTNQIAIKIEDIHRSGRTIESLSFAVGAQYADAELQYRLKAAIAALKAALTGHANMAVTHAAYEIQALSKGVAAFGDKATNLRAWLMHSEGYNGLVDSSIEAGRMGEIGGVVYGAQPGTLNRPALVTDDLGLVGTMFGLAQNAVQITADSQPPVIASETSGGKENIKLYWQAEGTFNIGLKGFTWSGSSNPTMAALGTASNWTQVANSHKSLAAVMISVGA